MALGSGLAKNLTKDTLKDTLKGTIKGTTKNALKDTVKGTIKNTAKDTFKKVIIPVVIVGGLAAAAGIESNRKNKIDFKISKIEDMSTLTNANHPVKITFSPGEEISKKDTVTISNTDCTPVINGEFPVYSVISSTQIEILLDDKLISNGTQGDMKTHTSVGNQLGVGASEVTGIAKDVGGGIVGGALDGIGLNPSALFSGNGMYISIAIIVIIILLCISSVGIYFIK